MKTNYSQLRELRRCPQRWYYSHVEGLMPKVPSETLEVGSLGHKCLAAFYKGEHWEDVLQAERDRVAQEDETGLAEQIFEEAAATLNDIMPRYEAEAPELDKQYITKIRFVEKKWALKVPGTGTIFRGMWDLVTKDKEGWTWLWEHKFIKMLQAYETLEYDEQTHDYLWGLRQYCRRFGKPWKVAGIIFNLVRQKPVKSRPEEFILREKTYRTDRHLDEIEKGIAKIALYQQRLQDAVNRGLNFGIYRNMFMGCFDCQHRVLCLNEYKGVDCTPLRQSKYIVDPTWNDRRYR